jgi:hypothetical protein
MIDHLVWYCVDLAQGLGQIAGFADVPPVAGGSHPGEGTAIALLSLGPVTYLEILGRDPAQPPGAIDPAIAALTGTGLYHWAVGGLNPADLQRRAAAAGLRCSAPASGGRVTPGGQELRWTCWGLRDHGFGALVPFFIDWHGTPHPATTAPRGARLASFEVFSPRAGDLQAIFDALGLSLRVTVRAGAGFAATLASGRGRLQLHSFDPVPSGYII